MASFRTPERNRLLVTGITDDTIQDVNQRRFVKLGFCRLGLALPSQAFVTMLQSCADGEPPLKRRVAMRLGIILTNPPPNPSIFREVPAMIPELLLML